MWNNITGIVGPKGSGKSHKAAELVGLRDCAAIYQIVRKDTNYLGVATDIFDGDIKAFCVGLGEEQFRYIYRPQREAKHIEGNKIVLPDFSPFVACCFERGNMTMVVDEAHFLCNPRYIPAQFWESIITGRHEYIDIIWVSQRFSMIHHDLTANTNELYLYRLNEPADLDVVEKRCGREIRDRVANLRAADDQRKVGGQFHPGEYFRWTSGEGGSTDEGSTVVNNNVLDMQDRYAERSGVPEAHRGETQSASAV
jgi:hypothetical protein